MRVLIVSTNRSHKPLPVLPYGACLVAESASRSGHVVQLLDLMFERNPTTILKEVLNQFNPQVVGFSVRNIDNNDMIHPVAYIEEVNRLADVIRRNSPARLVLGGAAIPIMPLQLLHATGADWAVMWDGDILFPQLLNILNRGGNPADIPGIVSPNQTDNRQSPNYEGGNPPRILAPDLRKWINVKSYASMFSPVPLKTQWGCPFDCIYCTYPITEGKEYRLASPAQVVADVRQLINCGATDIEFVDNVFNSPYEHALGVCRALAAAEFTHKVRFHTVELNPAFLDDELLNAMESAGFAGIGITAESAVDPVLTGLGKNYCAADVAKAATLVNRHKIPCFWVFLLGGPGETQESVHATLEFAGKEIRSSDPVFFNVGLRIYPGTKLEILARAEGILRKPADQMLEPSFYFSSHLDTGWLQATLKNAVRRHFNFITPNEFSLPFLDKVYRLAYRVGLKPPIWRYTRLIRRGLNLIGEI
jgi:radical SAM superfamily enzyme YgiQ (UPF0313 family)